MRPYGISGIRSFNVQILVLYMVKDVNLFYRFFIDLHCPLLSMVLPSDMKFEKSHQYWGSFFIKVFSTKNLQSYISQHKFGQLFI